MKPIISGKGKTYETDVVSFRRELHQYPELSGEEYETSKRIKQKLEQIGVPFTSGYAKTGVLGVLEGNGSGPTVALRADIDALPIQEETELPYASKVPGKMHACGHDAHTAMLWGAACILKEVRQEWPGKILLVFQPAEEQAPYGGAQRMIDDGVFEEHKPDCIFAQHVWPGLPVGQIGVLPGPMMGASDRFKVSIKGQAGHASMPHQGVDAIAIATQVISSLQTIVSRNTDPLDSAVVTVGQIQGGYRYNVLADRVVFEGTVRTFGSQVKERVKARFHEMIEQVSSAMGGHAEIEYFDGYPATVNDSFWAEHVRHSAQQLLGSEATPPIRPCLGGEDFSRFLQHVPGAYYWLGTEVTDGEQKPLHDPQFKLDERALTVGMELLAQTAIDALYVLHDRRNFES